jgi:fluoroacetyl-CoA thioesterase
MLIYTEFPESEAIMSDEIQAGLSETRQFQIDKPRTIGFMGEECRVYATPALVQDIEQTCRDMLVARLPEGEDSVGFTVTITHMAPTLLGMAVDITVTLAEFDGRKAVFDISASDPLDTICKGRHERFVVNVEKTRQRLLAKAEKAGQS